MRDVVVGSNGFIGKAVCKALPDALQVFTSASGASDLSRDASWLVPILKGADRVFLCAGRTGGVGRMKSDPMSFVYPNVKIHMNVFDACKKAGVRHLVTPGSTTGYPDSPDPMKEDQYAKGPLHPAYFVPGTTHRFIRDLASMQDMDITFFRPSNVYGPENSFDPQFSHVIEATIRKVAERQDPFVIWGTGEEIRDAIYIDDLAEAMVMDLPPGDYNVGSGEEMSVNRIVEVLLNHTGFRPKIEHDLSKPTAIPARRVNCSKLRSYGWVPKVSMQEGLEKTYDWYAGI